MVSTWRQRMGQWVKQLIQKPFPPATEKGKQYVPTYQHLPHLSEHFRSREILAPIHYLKYPALSLKNLNFTWVEITSGEGNGNPLQCSCLENPVDGGAWWAAVYGVAQSRSRLKRLSSSSSSFQNGFWLYMITSLPANAGNAGDRGSFPGSRRPPGVGNGNLLQYSCLKNSTDRGAWWVTVHGVAKNQTRLSNWAYSTPTTFQLFGVYSL